MSACPKQNAKSPCTPPRSSFSKTFSRASILDDFMGGTAAEDDPMDCDSFEKEFMQDNDDDSENEIITIPSKSKEKKKKCKDKNTTSKPKRKKKDPLPVKYTCAYCNKPYKRRSAYEKHVRAKHVNEDGTIRLDIAPTSTPKKKKGAHTSSKSLELGRRITCEDGSMKFECKICGKLLRQKNLYRHAKIHERDAPKVIDLVSTTASPASSTPTSESTTPAPSVNSTPIKDKPSLDSSASPNPFQCSFCQKSFSQKSNRIRHEATIHRGLKPFQCIRCGKRVSSNQSLKKHMKIHETSHAKKLSAFYELKIRWSCKFCGRNDFPNWDAMDDHRMNEHPVLTGQIRYTGFDADDEEDDDIDLVSVSDSTASSLTFEAPPPLSVSSVIPSRIDVVVPASDDSDVYVFSDSD